MKEEKVYFESNGEKICGVLTLPDKGWENVKNPLVILCHGFTSSKDSSTYKFISKEVYNDKILTLRIDFSGHGESEGNFEDITISKGAQNILSAIDYVKKLDFVGKICLFGTSFGGVCSVIAASKTKDLIAIGLKCPALEMSKLREKKYSIENIDKWKKEGSIIHKNNDGKEFKLNYSFHEDALNINAYDAAKNISCEVFIVNGDKDNTVTLDQPKKLIQIIPSAKLEVIEGGDHHFDGMKEKVNSMFVKFFKEVLK